MIYTQEAIIIKTSDFSETDKLVSLISKEKGYIKSIAKGARKPTSKKTSHIDLGVCAKFHLATGKNFDVITEVVPVWAPEGIKLSLEKAGIMYFILELCEKFFRQTEQGSEIYSDLLFVLTELEKNNELAHNLKLLVIFESRLLHKTGFLRNITDVESMTKQEIRNYKIIKFIVENTFEDALRLKLNEDDIQNILEELYNQIVEILEREPKSYKFLKSLM